MLDIMRKHAASFMIKVILGMIIVSFVFFYGWSKINKVKKVGGASGEVVAKIDGYEIPSAEYTFFYEQTIERLGKQFKVKDRKSLDDLAKSMALNQTISRHLLLEMAKNAGFEVSDKELAKFIMTQFTNEAGFFDSNFYLNRYLPYFKNRYGIDYETIAKQDLTIASFQDNFDFLNTTTVPLQSKEKEWTFTIVEFENNAKPEELQVAIKKNEDLARSMLNEKSSKNWKKLSKKYNATFKNKVSTKLSERKSLFNAEADDEVYEKVFSLNQTDSIIESPITIGNRTYIVALESTKDIDSTPKNKAFLENWLEARIVNAKIKTFLK